MDGNSCDQEVRLSIQETNHDDSWCCMFDRRVPSEEDAVDNSPAARLSTKLGTLPMPIYKQVCAKLNIRRDERFDDFRMLAEKIGFSRDQIRVVEKSGNPTDEILVRWSSTGDVTVENLIDLLKTEDLERMDVAKILEDWVYLRANTE